MKRCLNAACPGHRGDISDDYARCPTCGGDVESHGPSLPASTMSVGQPAAKPGSRSLASRVMVTVGCLAAYLLAQRAALPGVDVGVLRALVGGADSAFTPHVSVVALGLMPWVSAFMLVEFATLVIPYFKRLARAGMPGRQRLNRIALPLTFVLAAVQAQGLILWIERLDVTGQPVVASPGVLFRVGGILTLLAGVAFLVALLQSINTHGVGHGFSVLTLLGLFTELGQVFPAMRAALYTGEARPAVLLLSSLFLVGVVALGMMLILAPERLLGATPIPLRMPSCGLVPITLGASLLMLPVSLASFIPVPDALRDATAGPAAHYVLALPLGVLLGMLFHRGDRVSRTWMRLRAEVTPERVRPLILQAAARGAVAVLALMWAAQEADRRLAGVQASVSAVSLLTAVAIVLDLLAEAQARRERGALACVVEVSDTDTADMLAAALAQQRIPAHLRAVHHRTLLQWFGPYVPIAVMVPAARLDDAVVRVRALLDAPAT